MDKEGLGTFIPVTVTKHSINFSPKQGRVLQTITHAGLSRGARNTINKLDIAYFMRARHITNRIISIVIKESLDSAQA